MNLKEKIYKNYRELCKDMDWKPTGGKTKQLHLKDLERYCNFHKEGNKFIIDEIFSADMIKEKEDIRNKYNKYIEKLIIHELSKRPFNNDKYTISVARNTLYNQLHMVNDNYNICRNNINKFSRYIKVPTSAVHDFYNNTSSKLKDNVERTLNKLQDQCLIKWDYKTTVSLRNGTSRDAREEEINTIIEAERKALVKVEEFSKREVFKKGKWNNFQKEVSNFLMDTNIKYYFKSFLINTTSDFRKMLLEEVDLEFYRSELNATLYLSTIDTAKKKQKKVKEKNRISSLKNREYYEEPRFENEKVQISDEYIDYAKSIADHIIEIDTYKIIVENFDGISSEKYTLAEYLIDQGWDYEDIGYLSFDGTVNKVFG